MFHVEAIGSCRGTISERQSTKIFEKLINKDLSSRWLTSSTPIFRHASRKLSTLRLHLAIVNLGCEAKYDRYTLV